MYVRAQLEDDDDGEVTVTNRRRSVSAGLYLPRVSISDGYSDENQRTITSQRSSIAGEALNKESTNPNSSI